MNWTPPATLRATIDHHYDPVDDDDDDDNDKNDDDNVIGWHL